MEESVNQIRSIGRHDFKRRITDHDDPFQLIEEDKAGAVAFVVFVILLILFV
jgi:hypothetical protein